MRYIPRGERIAKFADGEKGRESETQHRPTLYPLTIESADMLLVFQRLNQAGKAITWPSNL